MSLEATIQIQKFFAKKINKNFKILHIANFGIKNDHRLFNLSIAKKISNDLPNPASRKLVIDIK